MVGAMELLRANVSYIRIPEPIDRIFKHERFISFDTPKSEGGLYVDMASFLAFGSDFVQWNYEKTGNPVYLHIKQTKKVVAEDRPSKKPTILGVDGVLVAVNLNMKKHISSLYCQTMLVFRFPWWSCHKRYLRPARFGNCSALMVARVQWKVRLAVDAILMAKDAERKEQVWSHENWFALFFCYVQMSEYVIEKGFCDFMHLEESTNFSTLCDNLFVKF